MTEITPTWPSLPAPRTTWTPGATRATGGVGVTHPGFCRPANEDAFLVAPELGIAAVADGVASSAGGAVASTLVIAAVRDFFERETTGRRLSAARPDHLNDIPLLLLAAANEGHRRIQEEAVVTGLLTMATTLSILLLAAEHAFVLHVGDSRVHRLRGGVIEQVTDDHTALADWVNQHGPPPEMVKMQLGHIITRAVSASHEVVRPDIWVGPAQPGDLFVLSTDGLTNVVSEDVIRDFVLAEPDPEAAARQLIDAALAAGGPDNVTVVLFPYGAAASGDRGQGAPPSGGTPA